MQFSQKISITQGRTIYGTISSCSINLTPGLYAHRLSIELNVSSIPHTNGDDSKDFVILERMDGDLYLEESPNSRLLIGRLQTSTLQWPITLPSDTKTMTLTMEIASNDLLLWADRTLQGDMRLEIQVLPQLTGKPPQSIEKGIFTVPHSEWLRLLEKSNLCRFEHVIMRTPARNVPSFPVFDEAFNFIKKAQSAYDRGDFNVVGTLCRSGFRCLIGWAKGRQPSQNGAKIDGFEALLASVTDDARRNMFAIPLIKGLNDVLNQATHLEGGAGKPPIELRREDALLCLHWYASVIGYIADVENSRIEAGGPMVVGKQG